MPAACPGPTRCAPPGRRRPATPRATQTLTRCSRNPSRMSLASRKASASISRMTASSASRCAPLPISRPGAPISSVACPALVRRRPGRRARSRHARPADAHRRRALGAARILRFLCAIGAGVPSTASRPACIGPIAYSGAAALRRDLADLKAAADAARRQGGVRHLDRGRQPRDVLPRPERALSTCRRFPRGDRRRRSRSNIARSSTPVSCCSSTIPACPTPGTCSIRIRRSRNTSATRLLRIEALNQALAGIPEDRVRYHICWGSWHGPHTTDLPLKDIVDVMLRVKAQAYSVEAGNVRHEHEYKVWRDVKLPDGKILIPGVVSHATNVVEHPELVADRLIAYAECRRARERHRRHRLRPRRPRPSAESLGKRSSKRSPKAQGLRARNYGGASRCCASLRRCR